MTANTNSGRTLEGDLSEVPAAFSTTRYFPDLLRGFHHAVARVIGGSMSCFSSS